MQHAMCMGSSNGSNGFARLITFDKRGTGLSDRSLGVGTLEDRMDDIRAVFDACGLGRASIVATSSLGSPFTSAHASQVSPPRGRFSSRARYATSSQAPGSASSSAGHINSKVFQMRGTCSPSTTPPRRNETMRIRVPPQRRLVGVRLQSRSVDSALGLSNRLIETPDDSQGSFAGIVGGDGVGTTPGTIR